MVMIFSSEKVLKHLLKRGYVYTFRTNDRKLGRDWITYLRGRERIGEVVIEAKYVNVNPKTGLGRFVKYSGFDTIEEWCRDIARWNGGKLPKCGYIYLVRLLWVRLKGNICSD